MNQTKKKRPIPINHRNYHRTRTKKKNSYLELSVFPKNTICKQPKEKIYPSSHPIEEGLWDNWMN